MQTQMKMLMKTEWKIKMQIKIKVKTKNTKQNVNDDRKTQMQMQIEIKVAEPPRIPYLRILRTNSSKTSFEENISNFKIRLIRYKVHREGVCSPETQQQRGKRNIAFRDTVPSLSVYVLQGHPTRI